MTTTYYICGPMSGLPDANYPAFRDAERQLREAGAMEVLNPIQFATPADRDAERQLGRRVVETPGYRALLDRCLTALALADIVVMLDGWQGSFGATREQAWAYQMQKTLLTLSEAVSYARREYKQALDRQQRMVEAFDIQALVNELANQRRLAWTGDPDCAPVKSPYAGDAGLDLTVSEDTRVYVGQFADVPLGISIQLPARTWAMLTGRSSTIRKRRLLVTTGIVDNGYRGPLFAGVQNVGPLNVELKRGERIAQLIPFGLVTPGLAIQRVAELEPSDRGDAAFGSTGGFA